VVHTNKKGIAEGVDWVIAIGLFMVYLGLVFVFFKPGVNEVHNFQDLSEMVEEKIGDSSWSMVKIPIFTEPIKHLESDNSESKFDNTQEYTLKFKDFAKVAGIVSDENIKADGFNVKSIDDNGGLDYGFDDPDLCVKFKFKLKDTFDYTRLVVFYSKDLTSNPSQGLCDSLDKKHTACLKESLDKEKKGEGGEEGWKKGDSSKECGALYKLGSAEVLEGLKLDTLIWGPSKYEKYKEEWKFPSERDFKVVFYNKDGGVCNDFMISKENEDCYIGKFDPPETANVFVREVNMYVLKGLGELVPYTFNIRIW